MVKYVLSEAFKIVADVHGNQLDRSGGPYIFHILRVFGGVDTEEEKIVAILHDTIEDAPAVDRGSLLIRIDDLFGASVLDAVTALTRSYVIAGESYPDYIRRLSTNPLAVKVKFADLKDNLNEARLAKLPIEERIRLRIKYTQAFELLTDLTTQGESKPMTTRFIPLGERVLVRPIATKPQEETKLILNDAHEEQVLRGEVIASRYIKTEGKNFAMEGPAGVPSSGEIIAYAPYSGKELSINGEKLLILTEEEILGIFEEV